MVELAVPIPELSKADVAFPASALEWMPPEDQIPHEFRKGGTIWNDIVDTWFALGLSADVEFYPREGVDAEKAYTAIEATLRSYAPRHEHKAAATAYMLSVWFERVEKWQK